MKIKTEHSFIFSTLLIFLLPVQSCDVARQAQQTLTLTKCDFRLRSVENVNVAGIAFQNIRSVTDLGITDMAKIMGAMVSAVLPLSLQLNIEGRNPNPSPAGLNRLEWILFIDDIQMTSGILDRPFVIPPDGGTITIPLQVAADLKKVLSGKSAEALLNFCMNLTGTGTGPTRFAIKLKPTILIGNTPVTYPGYITVKTEYSGN